VIAMTGNRVADSVPFNSTMWSQAGFTGQYQDLSFRPGRLYEIPHIQQLSKVQNDIWNKFEKWRKY
jgi:hypothetical protein